jgi:hypothetical protein
LKCHRSIPKLLQWNKPKAVAINWWSKKIRYHHKLGENQSYFEEIKAAITKK